MTAVDLDLAQVRAFVAVAEQLSFSRAAESLALTQQGLSKRIARLEDALETRLFTREHTGVRLTGEGERFLEPARTALAAGDAAVDAVRGGTRPIRLDVWGHLFEPLRTVREALAAAAAEAPQVEVGPGRDLPGVAAALTRGETGVGFGRFHPLEDGAERVLAHRLVRLEPVDVVLAADHPLARRTELRPSQLAELTLVPPAAAGRLDFLGRFAERFGAPMLAGEANLGLDHLLARVRATPDGCTLLPSELPLDAATSAGLVAVPLVEPTPLYAWSLVWHRDRPVPGLPRLLRAFADAGRSRRWLEYQPGRDWLPESDRDEALTGRQEP
ncbi:LysR family transcriptional regulator [Streptacidiphilus fuscans]|uniref:LysR family transcriptional regulator n=1 Tax=Streptacidiphilus fuscans TaxID=2789292 RepID=A0A931B5G5_9ACTN|nr:LysR family transcriptional regulator [Streptacidiphilus fuscans]MBF9069772.1 LysR family transcriptional regulator [Streptacidiphilus fuscans]